MIFILPYWVTKAIRDNKVILFNWKTNNSVKIHDVYHPIYDFKIEIIFVLKILTIINIEMILIG